MDNVQDPVQVAPQGQAEPTVSQTPTAQPAGAPAEAQKSPTGTTFEELAAKQGFKSPDDLATAYQNLRRQSTQVSQKAADLERIFFEQPKGTVEPQEVRTYPNDEQRALDELRKFVNAEAVEPLKRDLQQQFKTEVARLELKGVIKDHPDFVNYADDIKQLKSKYPDMPFDEAYTFAKAMKGDLINEAKAEGLRQGTYAAQRQGAAQVVTQKPVPEEKVQPTDLLQGAGLRWSEANKRFTNPQTAARVRAEQELIERELIERGATGLETNIRDISIRR